MPVVTQQPGGSNPFQSFENEWQVGLFDCCDDINLCCYAYLCSCCFMSRLGKDIGEGSFCDCCIPSRGAVYRMKVRSILRIKGSAVNDCCTVSCCGFCAAIQMKKELKNRGMA